MKKKTVEAPKRYEVVIFERLGRGRKIKKAIQAFDCETLHLEQSRDTTALYEEKDLEKPIIVQSIYTTTKIELVNESVPQGKLFTATINGGKRYSGVA